MDNFSRSHRCTSDVRLWLGARLVLVTPARPACLRFLLLGLFAFASTLALTPILRSLVLPELDHVFPCPALHTNSREHPFTRSWYQLFLNPAMQSGTVH